MDIEMNASEMKHNFTECDILMWHIGHVLSHSILRGNDRDKGADGARYVVS